MTLLGRVFFPPAEYRGTALSTIAWWEKRRLAYNVILGGTGLFTLAAIGLISVIPPRLPISGPPFGLVLAYGLAANVCYSLGWGIEIALKRIMRGRAPAIGPALFRQGVAFSVGLTLLPILLASFAWVVRTGLWLFHG